MLPQANKWKAERLQEDIDQYEEWEKDYEWDGVSEVVQCGTCDWYHRPEYTGDCRNDAERFPTWVGGDYENQTREMLDELYIKQLQKLLWEACNFIIDHKTANCKCNRCDLIRRVHEYQSIVDRRWV